MIDKTYLYCKRVIEAIERISSLTQGDEKIFVDSKQRISQSAVTMQLIHIIESIKKITKLHPELYLSEMAVFFICQDIFLYRLDFSIR